MIYVTADTHFGHENIIRYCNRPFKEKNHMDNELIRRWNETIKPEDIVYHLGDFCFGDERKALTYFQRLRGNIKIIPSIDHDKSWSKNFNIANYHFLSGTTVELYPPIYEIKYNKMRFILCHYPIEFWSKKHYGSIHLHGHSHGHSTKRENRYDVGVDCWDFYPVSLEKILKINNKS